MNESSMMAVGLLICMPAAVLCVIASSVVYTLHRNTATPKPALKAAGPVPKDAVPPPKDAVPPPKDAVPAPKDAVPAPKDAVPAPKDAVPAPKDAAPAPPGSRPPPEAEKMLLNLGTSVHNLYDWVRGEDGLWYMMSSSASPSNRAKCLAVLIQVNDKLRRVSDEMNRSLGHNSMTSRFAHVLNWRDRLKASFIGLMSDDHPEKVGFKRGTVGGFATPGPLIFMSEGWCLVECTSATVGECIGSILHEVAHAICPIGTCVAGEAHGQGFCRVQAMLHQAAMRSGVFVPVTEAKKKWAAMLPAMTRAIYPGDCLKCCDSIDGL
jgi:hypothetical protein